MLSKDESNESIGFAVDVIYLATLYDFSVTSWIRTAEHNAELPGSVPNSQHLVGLAVDVVRGSSCDKAAFISTCTRMGLDVIDEPTHLHVMMRRSK